jgi:hypothetical protein
MKESMWGYWIIVLGIAIMSVMVLLQNMTTTNEQDYYLIKNCLEASMYDAIDYGYYRDTGDLKMNSEKFVESFVRRFSEIINLSRNYDVDFYDIYEQPPAASVSVQTKTKTGNFGTITNSEGVEITNRLTGILYTNSLYNPKS